MVLLLLFLARSGRLHAQTLAPTPTPIADSYEPNDNIPDATSIVVGQQINGLTLAPVGDEDYFTLYLKSGQHARVTAVPLDGLDPKMSVYTNAGSLLGENDDIDALNLSASVGWQAPYTGWYTVRVHAATPHAGTYQLLSGLELATPTPMLTPTLVPTQTLVPTATVRPTLTPFPTSTPRPTVTPTWPPTRTPWPTQTPAPTNTPWPTRTPVPTATPIVPPDVEEPNNSRQSARDILPNTVYELTLSPYDQDYFRLLTKPDTTYHCFTTASNVDTQLTIFNHLGAEVAQNDDEVKDALGSGIEFYIHDREHRVLYVESLVGAGQYTLLCEIILNPVTPEPTATPYVPPRVILITPVVQATAVPFPTATAEPTATPEPSPTAVANIQSRQLPSLVPTQPPPTPEIQTRIRVQVAYDLNDNNQADFNEGVAGVSVRVLAQGKQVGAIVTDSSGVGEIQLTGSVDTLSIPFLGWQREIRIGQDNEASILLPAVTLPVFMPVEIEEVDGE